MDFAPWNYLIKFGDTCKLPGSFSSLPPRLIILLVSFGCENWSLTLRDKHRSRVSENRVVKRIFRTKRWISANKNKF
jgi:hypothetical protein